ncbi:MAG: bifunctional oligoribonuclease/PAP phosphatase NrnA [Clostridia bacterium]|nr:bifunctional oligoribonuclease/PAP phosphatase NrnA [Clostridia bacterium]
MTESDLSAILRALENSKNALVVGHSHPDGDCVGSAVALCEVIEALGGKASVLFPERVPLRLAFLLGDREECTELPENIDAYDVFSVDVASPSQLGDLREPLCGRVALRIDHHDVGVPYAREEFVEPSASATGEILYDLCAYAQKVGRLTHIPQAALDAAFGAISSDTGCFKYANVTPGTHLRAAKLIEAGAHAAEINRLLFETKELSQLRAEGIAQNKLRLFADGRISSIAIERSEYGDGLSIGDFETAIDIARSVRGTVSAAVIKASPTKENTYRVSLRSNGLNVAEVAAAFGGGGHIRAAGCTLECATAAEAQKMIVEALEAALDK